METVNDIVREMRERDDECGNGWLEHYADRVDAAYKRDLQSMVDASEIDMRTAMDEVTMLREENKCLKDCIHGKCVRDEVDAEPCTYCPHKENERLRAALKPIINFRPEICGNYGEEEAWDADKMMEAMVEAQRICNGGGAE